jgi:hypothetical protein
MAKDDREELLKFLEDPSEKTLLESKINTKGYFDIDMTDEEYDKFCKTHGIINANEVHEEIIRNICGNDKKLIKEIMDKLCQ